MFIPFRQVDQIPSDVFELGSSLSNMSGDFFMGLSGEIDPTKDLPPINEGEDVPAKENVGEEVAHCPPVEGSKIGGATPGDGGIPAVAKDKEGRSLFDDITVLDVTDESNPALGRDGILGNDVVPEETGVGVGGSRSRPKKLVPARHLGLMNREEVRRSKQVVYSSSSEDEYEVDPETGKKRQRVGFLFKTAPHPLFPNILTDDDRWKLGGCDAQKRSERAERLAGLVSLFSVLKPIIYSVSVDLLRGCYALLFYCLRWWGNYLVLLPLWWKNVLAAHDYRSGNWDWRWKYRR